MNTRAIALILFTVTTSGCFLSPTRTATIGSSSSSSTAASPSSGGSSTSNYNAVQLIPLVGNAGSFETIADGANTNTYVDATRFFDVSGNRIADTDVPGWITRARVRLSYTAGTSANNCAYFDTDSSDTNPGNSGYYTIDGYYNPDPSNPTPGEIDHCAIASAADVADLRRGAIEIVLNRSAMAATDKIQLVVTARPLDAPNTAVSPASCTAGGYFDPSNCTNQLFSVSLRSAPGAAASPRFLIFPSAKSADLMSEQILLPLNINPSFTTISIDRIKGGAVFYSVLLMRIP